jgi:hypothetical protein
MGTLHSLTTNLIAAATLYGWRLDAIVVSGVLWALVACYSQIMTPSLVAATARVSR